MLLVKSHLTIVGQTGRRETHKTARCQEIEHTVVKMSLSPRRHHRVGIGRGAPTPDEERMYVK